MSFDGKVVGVVVVGAISIFLFLSWSCIRRFDHRGSFVGKKSCRLPPSPPASSIIMGHRLSKNSFLTFASWFEQYGPLISLRTGAYHYVVIGRHKAAMEIMEKQGGALVDRPRMVASGELLGGGFRVIHVGAGERFKRMRRALQTHLQPKATQAYESMQMSHVKEIILGLRESPERYLDHARAYSASVILELTYGKNTPTQATHPDMIEIRKSFARFGRSLRPGTYLVDGLPWLKYLPWYGRELRQGFIDDRDFFHRLLDRAKSQMGRTDSGPSFMKFLLSREMDFGLDETEMAFLGGGLFTAGADTLPLAICIAMAAAACFPNAQAAVHAELDAVVGNDRPPTFDDEKYLPVLRAFILESMRWKPVAPLGIAHRATEDIVWGDYYIPAGTTVVGNHWAISRDPEAFPDPDRFDLRRWLTSDGNLRNDLKYPAFGFGRRVCPGQHLATKSIYICMAFIFWSFRLYIDESMPVDDMAFLSGSLPDVAPIGLRFEPRHSTETLKWMMENSISY